MATLILTKVFVTLLSTQESISAYSTGRGQQHQMEGEVRTYAGGRQRAFASEGIQGSFTFTLRQLTLDDIETLKSWMGEAVVVRDHRGQKFYGVYHTITPDEMKESTFYDVTIPLKVISFNEEV